MVHIKNNLFFVIQFVIFVGMLTLGIKEYEKYPKTDENYMVDETTFVEEA